MRKLATRKGNVGEKGAWVDLRDQLCRKKVGEGGGIEV